MAGKGKAAGPTGPADGLVLGATANGPQKRARRKSDWTPAKANRFIAALADSCNVSLAARAVKRSVQNVYAQRARDGEFRAQWDQALSIGYARLEMMMLERALHGTEKVIRLQNGESKVMREYSDRVALSLLRMHRENVAAIDQGPDEEEYQEACQRIIDKLDRLREREDGAGGEGAGAGAVETKAALGRAERIDAAVGRIDAAVGRGRRD